MSLADIKPTMTSNSDRVDRLIARLGDCDLCPRKCHVDRYSGTDGECGMGAEVRVSSANLHFGEEPPLSGTRGSGTIFLTGCNMKCVYCQNYPISQLRHGSDISHDELVEVMFELKKRGAHNINFVTPTHYSAQIAAAIAEAREKDLGIPIVWNSSGYDSVDVLKEIEGLVDIYLPDMRYADAEMSDCYSSVKDYPEVNRAAILEMFRQVGLLERDSSGIAKKGLIIRHLVLPEDVSGTREILKFIAENVSRKCYISLMSQYFPAHRANEFGALSRRLKPDEYERAAEWMDEFNLENGWCQNEEI